MNDIFVIEEKKKYVLTKTGFVKNENKLYSTINKSNVRSQFKESWAQIKSLDRYMFSQLKSVDKNICTHM